MSDKIYEPSNANMQQGARNVLKYLASIRRRWSRKSLS